MAQNKVFGLGGIGSPCCCGGTPTTSCGGCEVPAENLTLSWPGASGGSAGSITMVYSGAPAWISGCLTEGGGALQYNFSLACAEGNLILGSDVFVGGCPDTPFGSCNAIIDSLVCGDDFLLTAHFNTSCSLYGGYYAYFGELTIQP